MRNSELMELMENDFKEQYTFIMTKLNECNSRGEKCFYLGFRDKYICLYYKGMCVAKINRGRNKQIQYIVNPYYLEGLNIQSPLSFEQIRDEKVFSNILCQIEKHVTGKHGKKGRNQREKVCQQWIANMNNSLGKEWFYVDMEYIYDKDPYGRPDLIAINREQNKNGKHSVALIELKIRHSQYKGMTRKTYKKNKEKYDILKQNLFDEKKEVKKLKFGSGIVSHLADYLRFLNNEKNYMIQMREEIVNMIQANVEVGLIDKTDKLASITTTEQLEEKPLIYIITYSYTPYHPGEKEKKAKMKSMKRSLYNVLYGKGTPFGLINMINNSQVEGLLANESEYKDFIQNDSKKQINRIQNVNGKDYKFIFSFKDPDEESSEPWDCL